MKIIFVSHVGGFVSYLKVAICYTLCVYMRVYCINTEPIVSLIHKAAHAHIGNASIRYHLTSSWRLPFTCYKQCDFISVIHICGKPY